MKNSIYAFLLLATLLGSCSSVEKDDEFEKEMDEFDKEMVQSDNEEKAREEARNKEIQEKAEAVKADSLLALEIKGYKLTKISGSSRGNKVEYESVWQIIEGLKEDAKKEMWTDKDLSMKIENAKSYYSGGRVNIQITRATDGVAELQYFTCIIKGSEDEKELFRKTHGKSRPSYSVYTDDYTGFGSFSLDNAPKTPFHLYLIDKFADEPLKFKVTAIKR